MNGLRSFLPTSRDKNLQVLNPLYRRHIYVIENFSLLAMIALTGFGIQHTTSERHPLGTLELASAGTLLINLIGLYLFKNVNLSRTCFLLTILVVMIIMLTTGGVHNTGIFWVFVFPPAAFFLAGRVGGLAWVGALYGVVGLLVILEQFQLTHLSYDVITIRQLLVALGVVAVGTYAYQYRTEVAEREQRNIEQTKSEFLTLASHQLRTPISAIAWFSEMLLQGDAGKITAEPRKHIQQIYDSNQRLANIVDSLLTVSSLEMNSLVVRPETVDLPVLTHRLLQAQIRSHGADKQLHITEAYDDGLKNFVTDPAIVRTILRHLLSNAFKYTPANGQVEVALSRQAGTALISVSDTGYGIPRRQQKDIFVKLFRAKNIRQKDTDGTGLGLYIVKGLVERLGGKMSFTSAENKGSTFIISLPNAKLQKKGVI